MHLRARAAHIGLMLLRLAAIAGFVLLTNSGFAQRVALLLEQDRWHTLAGFLGIWALSLLAVMIAAFHPRLAVRGVWAAILALTTAVGFTYRRASGTDFGVLDAISLWSARHEAARAAEFYAGEMLVFVLVLVAGFVALVMPPALKAGPFRRHPARLALVPVLPVALIAAVVIVKEGGGAQVLPTQFAPLSVALVSASRLAATPVPERRPVTWTPRTPALRHIVLLVDESVRGDYLDWTPGNPYTPALAHLRERIVDFGPAAAGGNCSHYANALLRFAAARDHLGAAVLTSPTLWHYARHAGFRTVFIDAQAAFNRNPGKLQNFMTGEEAGLIDRLVTLPESVPVPELDDRLLDIVLEELRGPGPVFIYANKNGAHFPYDSGYPASERVFRPTMGEALQEAVRSGTAPRTVATYVEGGSVAARVNSYRNVLRWTVDRFFKRLAEEAALSEAVVLYTSDHGQSFAPGRLSHCTITDPDPREALVPLFALSGHDNVRRQLAAGAAASRGHASHFEIAPTLLRLFGYRTEDVAGLYAASLFDANRRPAAFTSGDVFGLFSSTVRWHPIDLERSYLEPEALPQPAFRGAMHRTRVPPQE